MSQLIAANQRMNRKYGRLIKLRRESMRHEISLLATSRKYKAEELMGSKQQNMVQFRMLDEDIRDTPLCRPMKNDRILDRGGKIYSIESAQPVSLDERGVAWIVDAMG